MKDEFALAKELGVPLEALRRVAAKAPCLYMFQRRVIGKKKKTRVFRVPMKQLCEIQDRIKKRILDRISLPREMHGWRKRRSRKTYVANHIGKGFIGNVDIQDFFPSVSAGRVCAFWRSAGYSDTAAKLLTRLTTHGNQLPQGAKTSQAIGNQILRPLVKRLSILARKNRLGFANLGDEFAFSGSQRTRRLEGLILRIIEQEGFTVNPEKIKRMPRWDRQELAGLVANKKSSLGRDKFRWLKAILHNCVKYSPQGQNRDKHPNFKAHLRGKIAQFQHISPRLGKRLLAQFERIDWTGYEKSA
jgi:hypothetical protein